MLGIDQEIKVVFNHSSVRLSIGWLKYNFDQLKSYIERISELALGIELIYDVTTKTKKWRVSGNHWYLFLSSKDGSQNQQLKLKQISISFIMTMSDDHFDYFISKLFNLSQIDSLVVKLRDSFQILKLFDALDKHNLKIVELEVEYNKWRALDECKIKIKEYQSRTKSSVRFQNHSKLTQMEQEYEFAISPRF